MDTKPICRGVPKDWPSVYFNHGFLGINPKPSALNLRVFEPAVSGLRDEEVRVLAMGL